MKVSDHCQFTTHGIKDPHRVLLQRKQETRVMYPLLFALPCVVEYPQAQKGNLNTFLSLLYEEAKRDPGVQL